MALVANPASERVGYEGPSGGADVVNGHDVGMVERRGGAGLLQILPRGDPVSLAYSPVLAYPS